MDIYQEFIAECSHESRDGFEPLRGTLEHFWIEDYGEWTPHETDVLRFEFEGFRYMPAT